MSQSHDSDARRKARLDFAHRKALVELQRVTLRYQVHNELALLASHVRREALEFIVRTSLALVLFALAACGGPEFSSASDPLIALPDVATIGDALEPLDAGDVPDDARDTRDAAAAEAEASFRLPADAATDALGSVYLDADAIDAGDVDAGRVCIVVQLGPCAAPGFPYRGTCASSNGLACCCATP